MRPKEIVELSDGRKLDLTDCSLGQFREISKVLAGLGKENTSIEDVMAGVINIVGLADPEKLPMSDAARLYGAIMKVNDVAEIIRGAGEFQESAEKKA